MTELELDLIREKRILKEIEDMLSTSPITPEDSLLWSFYLDSKGTCKYLELLAKKI